MRVLALFVVTACTTPGPQRITDSSGAPFELRYDGAVDLVDGTPEPSACGANRPIYAWGLGRFIMIGSACAYPDGSWATSANLERPVACNSTEDCPQWQSWSFECRSGLCQNADTKRWPPSFVNWTIAYELCYAPFQRADTLDVLSPVSKSRMRSIA